MPVRLAGICGVVFDLDDTLYPESAYVESGFAAVGQWLRAQISCPADPAERLCEMFRAGRRGRLFDELLAEWGCPDADRLVPQMIACYRNHRPAIALHPDAQRAIQRWSGRFLLGLITDGPLASQQGKIRALGLDRLLDLVICTDQWGEAFRKPHSRAFEMIEDAWHVTGRDCVYIADNPSKDFVAPNRRGWSSIQVRRATGQYSDAVAPAGGEPQAVVHSMDEIDLTS